MNIAILIPTTTNKTNFKKLEDTHLHKFCLPSLCDTLPDNKFNFTIYLGIDESDKILNTSETKRKLQNTKLYKNISKINLITFDVEKGNVVAIWNELFNIAYNDNNDYFIQMGDDIFFHNKNWIIPCINTLQEHRGLGVIAPTDINNKKLLTQSIVSRKHMEIFGYYFNPEIKNWGCDNWITGVYPKILTIQTKDKIENKGGEPRYIPICDFKLWDSLLKKDRMKIKDYVKLLINNI